MGLPTNTLSYIATQIMRAGLTQSALTLPAKYAALANEMFNVPERPESYTNNVQVGTSDETAVLVSGGLDSTAIYFMHNKHRTLRCFYIDFGQPYAEKEMEALDQLCVPFDPLYATMISDHQDQFWKHIIPGRNFLAIALVAEQISGGEILFGATEGEIPLRGGDKSARFLSMTNELLYSALPCPVTVRLPLGFMTKTDIVAWMVEHGLRNEAVATISCFSEEEGHCGRCQACLRKALAFINNNMVLETVTPIKEGCAEYIEKYQRLMPAALAANDFSRYSRRRCEQDLAAIAKL